MSRDFISIVGESFIKGSPRSQVPDQYLRAIHFFLKLDHGQVTTIDVTAVKAF